MVLIFLRISIKKKNIIKKELSKKPLSKKKISKKLNNYNRVRLFKGDTKVTLPKFVKEKIKIDFAFIDGGHSFNTINSDWKNVNQIITKTPQLFLMIFMNIVEK